MTAFAQALLLGNPYQGHLFGAEVHLTGYSRLSAKIAHFVLELFTQVKMHNLVHELGHLVIYKWCTPTSAIKINFFVATHPGLKIQSEFTILPTANWEIIHCLAGPIASVLFARSRLILLNLFSASIPAVPFVSMAASSYLIIGVELVEAVGSAYKKDSRGDFGKIAQINRKWLMVSLVAFTALCIGSLYNS